jgi:murein L,D-transpeptidase YcbB/YkuD
MYDNQWKYVLACLLVIGVSLNGCGQKTIKTPPANSYDKDWDKTIPGGFSNQSKTIFDSTQVAIFLNRYPQLNQFAKDINRFYSKRKFAYAWYEDGKIIEQAGNLTNRVLNLQNEGLHKVTPYQAQLDSLFYNADTVKNKPNTQLELMLTAQYFMFSKLAWRGMNDSASKASAWYLPRKRVSYAIYLDSLLKVSGIPKASDEPVYRQYDLLRNYLKKYRDLDRLDPCLPIVSKSLKTGDSSEIVRRVKIRLFELQDYKGDTTSQIFDAGLLAAVKHFQERHGLSPNGIMDKATFLELNVPFKKRIQQILVNMERSRWLPVRLDGDYLAVNIPEFKLHVYHADSLLWSCKVVVGKTIHQTVVFYGEIEYVVFSPYWNVPPSIVSKEVIPGMKRNGNYLQAQNMEITGYLNGLPVVRQKPGPLNSLGLVKFLFPNGYNIYLHDTPSKSLFGESSRSFSHGCVRVKEPAKLAIFLLKGRPEWNTGAINLAMHSGKEKSVTLKNKVPVFIAYFTAFIDRNHNINFRKDIYNRDDKLAAMLMSGTN